MKATTPHLVSFRVSDADDHLIEQIVERATAIFARYAPLDARMDLTACHCNGTPLDLPKLLAAEPGDFIHDVGGIWRHLNRSTGELGDHFVPRCAQPEPPHPARKTRLTMPARAVAALASQPGKTTKLTFPRRAA